MLHLFIYRKKNVIVFLILISISVISISYYSNKAEKVLSNTFHTIASPFVWIINSVSSSISSTWDDVVHFNDKLSEMKRMRELIYKNQKMIADNEFLMQENLRLKKLLSYKKHLKETIPFNEKPVSAISAAIVMRESGSYHKTLIINKGSYHGVRENMPVIAFQIVRLKNRPESLERVVVGKISQVSYLAAKIQPLIDPACHIHVKLRHSNYTGFLRGRGNYFRGLLLSEVDKNIDSDKKARLLGEEIITSGGQSVFPGGIKVGRVVKDITPKSSFMKKVVVEPYLEFSRLESVFVLLKELPSDLKSLMDKKK